MAWTLGSFLFFTALVATIAWWKTRNDNLKSEDGYFLAGRGLSGWYIAAAMLLTNISAEQLIGLNGQSYRSNLSGMAWETTASFATVILAFYFLPRYLRGAFTTLPQFFEERYDPTTRRLMSCLLLLGYTVITLPGGVLYPGAVTVNKIFNIGGLLGLNDMQSLWAVVWFIGILGAGYAYFGGMKAVAVSDYYMGIGLLIGGLMVPLFGLYALGDGSITAGFAQLGTVPAKLNAIGAATDPVPFGTIFTGMIFANLFYWGTNQVIIQRALGAQSLAEGQRGVLIAGVFKILTPLIMMFPGLIAYHLFPDLKNPDLAYPTIVATVLPGALIGFFTFVLFSAVLSTYDALLHSAATMFCLDIYRPIFKPQIDEASLIRIGKVVIAIVALVSMTVAPFVAYAPEGLFQFMRRSTGFYNIPMIALMLTGFFTKRTSGFAARVAVGFYLVAYILLVFILDVPLHFIHIMGILFVVMVAMILVISRFVPRECDYVMKLDRARVDLTPWKWGPYVAVGTMGLLVFVYLLCSPLGLAAPEGLGWKFWTASAALSIAVVVGMGLCAVRGRVKEVKPWPDADRH